MSRFTRVHVSARVDVDAHDVIEQLAPEELASLGLRRISDRTRDEEAVDRICLAALTGNLHAFVMHVDELLGAAYATSIASHKLHEAICRAEVAHA